jgi:hypothetical protein
LKSNPIFILFWVLLWPISEVLGRPREVEEEIPWYKGLATILAVIGAFVIIVLMMLN